MMKKTNLLAVMLWMSALSVWAADTKESTLYELRTYYSPAGRLDDLHARFRNYTLKLFEKHGITNIGYWVPVDNKDNKLVYLISFPSREAREKSWKEFGEDPQWKEVKAKTEAKGPLVTKVDSVQLTATDFSPCIAPGNAGERAFELRTYTASPGKLENLLARFRDHTLKLFEKHGMTNLVYLTPIEGQTGAGNTLVYMLAHKSTDAAKASFDTFRQDPDWVAAKKASEDKAGGSLTIQDGVKSEFLKATDYSPLK